PNAQARGRGGLDRDRESRRDAPAGAGGGRRGSRRADRRRALPGAARAPQRAGARGSRRDGWQAQERRPHGEDDVLRSLRIAGGGEGNLRAREDAARQRPALEEGGPRDARLRGDGAGEDPQRRGPRGAGEGGAGQGGPGAERREPRLAGGRRVTAPDGGARRASMVETVQTTDGFLRHAGREFLVVLYTAFRSLKLYPLENNQVQKALDDLWATPNKGHELGQRLADSGVAHIGVEAPRETDEDVEDAERQKEAAKRTYARSVAVTKEVINSIRMGRTANVKKVKRAVQGIVDQV